MNAIAMLILTAVTVVPVKGQYVDLNRPGALEALKASDPDRFRQVAGVLHAAYDMSCDVPAFDRLIRTNFEALKTMCGPLVKTSLPPKRELEFFIGTTLYSKTIDFKSTEEALPMEDTWIPAR